MAWTKQTVQVWREALNRAQAARTEASGKVNTYSNASSASEASDPEDADADTEDAQDPEDPAADVEDEADVQEEAVAEGVEVKEATAHAPQQHQRVIIDIIDVDEAINKDGEDFHQEINRIESEEEEDNMSKHNNMAQSSKSQRR
jgi:hypothetical protein